MSDVAVTNTTLQSKIAALLKKAETPFYLFTNILDRIELTGQQRKSIKYPMYPAIIDVGADTPRDDEQTLEIIAQELVGKLEEMGKLEDLTKILSSYPG